MKDGKPLKGKGVRNVLGFIISRSFTKITQHPSGADSTFHPKSQGDDKPENILKLSKNGGVHRAALACKDSK